MKRLIIIRPEPGNSATCEAAKALGMDPIAMPLFEVAPLDWSPSELDCDALLIGSANALRHGGEHLASLVNLPVYAVGEATASLADQLGFHVASTGSGGLQAVVDTLPKEPMRLLRLAGEDHVALDLPNHLDVETRIAYRVVAQPISDVHSGSFNSPVCVALHSASAARHFLEECYRLQIDRRNISIIALGRRIARAAGNGWAKVMSTERPDDASLLAMAVKLCQTD